MPRGKGEGSITRRKDGMYMGRIELPSRDGTRRRKYLYAKTKTELLRKMQETKRLLEHSGDIPTASTTVTAWLDYWMQEVAVKTRRPKTVASYRSIVTIVTNTIGHTRLDKVTAATIRKVFTVMEADGLSSTYQRNTHAVMSAAFRDAEREGRMKRNPVELVDAPRKAVTHLEALTLDEAVNLLAVFADDPEGALWATFILTGARRGEVLGLEWDRVGDVLDLSWQLQRITGGQSLPHGFEYRHLTDGLYLTRPKTKAGWRIVPLVDPLKSILERYRDTTPPNPHGLLFTRNGRPYDPDYVTKMWPAILDAAGITKKVRVHDLRHTTVDLLYAAGVPEADILEIVGHSSRAMSRAYKSKGDIDRLRASMLQLSASVTKTG